VFDGDAIDVLMDSNNSAVQQQNVEIFFHTKFFSDSLSDTVSAPATKSLKQYIVPDGDEIQYSFPCAECYKEWAYLGTSDF